VIWAARLTSGDAAKATKAAARMRKAENIRLEGRVAVIAMAPRAEVMMREPNTAPSGDQ
jgi:hypothetical protein